MKYLILSLFIIPTLLFSEISISELNNGSWSKIERNGVFIYTKKDNGKVPIFCFHKIGNEPRYEITADNFENFLIYLNKNNFFPLSDKEFLERDLSRVPTGYTPIVLGADDASEGNFEYKTHGENSVIGEINIKSGKKELTNGSMVQLLEKHLKPTNGIINFTFYVSFNGIPFRQTGGYEFLDNQFRGNPLVKEKFNYIIDNFILGVHTFSHPVTKNTTPEKFKWELDTFYSILDSYVGDKISKITTLAYPYGCATLKPEMEIMIKNYEYKGVKIIGGFDFNGYFSHSPFSSRIRDYDVSRLGVDNKNIEKVYGFLESIKLFNTKRVIVVESRNDLINVKYTDDDVIIVGTK